MKHFYIQFIFLLTTIFTSSTLLSQGTEDFENIAINTDSFTRSGITFTSSNTNFDLNIFTSAGAGGSNRFFDNFGATATGATYTIATGGTLFTMQSVELYLSAMADAASPTANAGAQLRVRGLAGGTEVFTSTQTTGFPTAFGATNGFFVFNFTNAPGVGDTSSINIDTLEFTLIGDFQYIALDNFVFGAETVETTPPFVQNISIIGTPTTTATTVDFLVDFSENANNVSIDDFVLDAVGATGTISSVSSATGEMITVSVTEISGEGTISIDLSASNNIADDLGNNPSPAFTAGENHIVSRCFEESFESFMATDFTFTSNGINFTTTAANFSLQEFAGSGIQASDFFISNSTDQGTNRVYSVTTVGTELFTVEALYAYVSSELNGANPTNEANGVLTFRGKLGGSTLYTITKNSGFPSDFSVIPGVSDNGFSLIDFATAGTSDFSLTNIDELEVEIGGSFQYLAIDGFEHCEEVPDNSPPIVQIINLIGDPEASVTTVDYTVIFNENAINVSLDDFSITATGTSVGAISAISGSTTNYTVTVSGISGEGSIRLDLNAGTDIEDEDGNTPSDAFTSGELHLVSQCNIDTFEGSAVGDIAFTIDRIPLSTMSPNFSVQEILNGGAGASDRFLSNTNDQGVNRTYSIEVTNISTIFMNTIEMYVSSQVDGISPTDDGSITINGKRDNVILYTITKTSGFPTSSTINQGFFTLDFATDGASDFTEIDIDEIEIVTGGAFVYLAVDNFKFCDDAVTPTAICQDFTAMLTATDDVEVAPSDLDGGSTDNASNFFLGLETTSFTSETTTDSTQDLLFPGPSSSPIFIKETAFTVPVDGIYTFDINNITNNPSNGQLLLFIFDNTPIPNSGNVLFERDEYVGFNLYNSDGSVDLETSYTFLQGETYYMYTSAISQGNIATFDVVPSAPIIAAAPKTFTLADAGANPETLYVFDNEGDIDSCVARLIIGDPVNYVWDANAWSPSDPSGISTSIDTITILDQVNPATLIADTPIGDVTINAGTTLNLGNTVLSTSGNIVIDGTLQASTATIMFVGNTEQTISGTNEITTLNSTMDSSIGVILNAPLSIERLLRVTRGTLTTNDNLIFKSSASRTGQLDTMPAGAAIVGNVTVERFIPGRRAFRFLSSAVTTTTSIQLNWQEGGVNSLDNPNPGFGTHITGSDTGANGFDMTATGNASMFTLDNVAQTFQGVPNTDVAILNAGTPYRTLIRGSRAVDLTSNTATSDNTVLRATGTLSIGDVTQSNFSAVSGEFNFIGNPYQSSVDMEAVLTNSTNLNTSQYYIWDPTLGARGQYVTVLLPSGTNTSGSAANQYLQTGQGAFVTTLTDGAASILFEESDKGAGNDTPTFFTDNDPIVNNVSIIGQLFRAGSAEEESLLQDSFGIMFSDNYSNNITSRDAVKPTNLDENMGISNGESLLSIEQREFPVEEDVITLYNNTYRTSDYVLKLQVTNLNDSPSFLEDTFTQTFTALEEGENIISFSVNEGDDSSNSDRFRIVFSNEEVLAIESNDFLTLKMYPNPVNNQNLTISGNLLNTSKVTLQITNVLGQVLMSETLSPQNNTIVTTAMQSVPKGFYFVTIIADSISTTERVIKN